MTDFFWGHEAENHLPQALSRLGVLVCDRSQVQPGKDPGRALAIARATEHEDWHEGTDFWFYVRKTKQWHRLDLTTARDLEVLSRKKAKSLYGNVTVVRINGKVLEQASRGCEKDLLVVSSIFEQVIRDLTTAEKGGSRAIHERVG